MQRIFLLALCLLLVLKGWGQRGGESTYAYLQLPLSPRIAALGGKLPGYGGDKDLSLSIANPAFAHNALHNALEASVNLLFANIKYSYASYFYALDSAFTLGAHIQQMWYGRFARRDEMGTPDGTFGAYEMALGLHAAYRWNNGFSIGTSFLPLFSQLERYWSLGLACNLAVGYSSPDGRITGGIVAQNIGGSLKTYSGRHEYAPFELLAGIKIRMQHAPLVFVFTLQHLENWERRFIREGAYKSALADGTDPKEKPSLGQEIGYEILAHPIVGLEFHPVRYFFVQASYNHGRRMAMLTPAKYSFEGFSWGLGVQIRRVAVRFSRAVYHAAGASNHISVAIYLGGDRDAAIPTYHSSPQVELPTTTEDMEETEDE